MLKYIDIITLYVSVCTVLYCCELKGGRCDLFEGATPEVSGKHENPSQDIQ
jgi:hypothetical protein